MKKNTLIFSRLKSQRTYPVLSWLFLLLMSSQMSWGQGQFTGTYKTIDGGYEGQLINVVSAGNTDNAKWRNYETTTTSAFLQTAGNARSGSSYFSMATSSATNTGLPFVTAKFNATRPAASTQYTIQFYYKPTVAIADSDLFVTFNPSSYVYTATPFSLTGTTGLVDTQITSSAADASGWKKAVATFTTSATTTVTGCTAGIKIKAATASAAFYDDFTMYAGAEDNTAPDTPASLFVDSSSGTQNVLTWTAPASGVDGGGYLVVRYSGNPSDDSDPKVNGIYAYAKLAATVPASPANTIASVINKGTGSYDGTVVYSGTALTCTDVISSPSTYYYKVYTVDKAFNYSAEIKGTALVAPTLTADTTSNTVDNNLDITSGGDATWGAAITSVKIGGTALAAGDWDKTTTPGTLILKPSNGNSLLTASGSKSVVIVAAGYQDATVTQVINAGAVSASTSTVAISGALATGVSRTVTCTAKDQYSNLVSGYTFKYDAAITDANTSLELYTIDGVGYTASVSNASVATATNGSGVATFAVVLPATIDGFDGISVQVKLNDGTTTLGSAFSYTQLMSQTITFPTSNTVTYGVAPYSLDATASSGLTVSYVSSNTAVATVSGNTVTIVGAGSTNITASQAGNGSYNAATLVVQALTVNPLALTIPDAVAANRAYNGLLTTNITGTLTGIINLDDVTFVGTLKGTFADVNAANGIAVTSACTLSGTKTANYTLTQPTGLTADITKANQTITMAATATKAFGFADYSPATSATSGINPITYTSSNPAVATIVANQVHYVGQGVTTITASQAGNANYNAAADVAQTLTVGKKRVLFIVNSTFSQASGASDEQSDAVITMYKADPNYVVTTITTADGITSVEKNNTSDTTALLVGGVAAHTSQANIAAFYSNYDLLITQESFSGGGNIFKPTYTVSSVTYYGLLAIRNITIPVIYTKVYALQNGRAVTSTTSLSATITDLTTVSLTIDAAQQSNPLYSGISFPTTSLPLYKTKSDDTGLNTASLKVLSMASNLELGTTGTLLANVSLAPNPNNTILINDIPANTQFGTNSLDKNPARMIALGFNYGGIAEGSGKNVTDELLTLFRNAGYILTGQTVPTTLYVNPTNHQTITFPTSNTVTYGVAPYNLGATASSGLAVTYASDNSSVATVSGSTVTILGAGTAHITASQVGGGATAETSYWYAAPDVAQTLTVNSVVTWDGSVWSNITGPTSSLEAIIDGTYSGAGFDAKKLTINATKSLTINSGTNITVQNELINNGTVVVENNANLIQVNNTTNTGAITVNRNSSPLLRLDYTLWSSPVASQNLAAFSPLTSQSPSRFYTYDTANNQYSNAFDPTTTNFAAGTGYLIRMPNTADAVTPTAYAGQFTGVPNNGDVSVALSTAGSAYNLVGNPYPSTINLFTLQSNNSTVIGNTFYIWRKTNGTGTAYCSYVPTSTTAGTYVSNGNAQSPVSFVGNIQPGQGFFVSALTTGPLVFKNGQRVSTATSFLKTKQVAIADKLWLNATNVAGDFSQMAVTYFDGATPGVDAFDGKYISDSSYALTSNVNGGEYTIQGRPAFDATDIVPLNFKTDVAGDYTIAIDHAEGVFATGQSVILADAATGTETDLTTSSYTFAAAAGTANTRFSLKYQKTLGTNKAVFSENNVTVYKNKGTLYVNAGDATIANIKVYDVQGKLVAELKNGKATSATIANLKATNQVLVVKITSQDNKTVTKKVVN